MKYKALQSPKQITSFKDRRYTALDGYIEIDDREKEAITFFDKNVNWERVEETKKIIKEESEEVEQVKKKK